MAHLDAILKKTAARREQISSRSGKQRNTIGIATEFRPYDLPSQDETTPDSGATRVQTTPDSGATRVQTTPDSGATRVQTTPDSGATRVQTTPDSGATRVQTTPDSGATRVQTTPDSGATRVQTTPDSGATRVQTTPDSGATRVQTTPDSGATRVQTTPDSGATRVQTTPDSGATRVQTTPDSGATRVQTTPDSGATRVQTTPDSGATRVQTTPDSGATRVQTTPDSGATKKVLPRAPSKLAILSFLHEKAGSKAGLTGIVRRRDIAVKCGMSAETVKSSSRRLVKEGYLLLVEVDTSCKSGGSVYEIPRWVAKLFAQKISTRVQTSSDSGANDPVVVVGFKDPLETRTTTDSDHILAKMLSQLEIRLNLSERFKIAARDLADAFRKCGLAPDKFAMSVEHVAFHAGGEAGVGLRNPGRWIIKQLSEGYVHEPTDFESWAECQERAMLQDAQKRLQRLHAVQMQRLDVDFKEHMLNLSVTDKQRLLRGSEDSLFFAETPNSAMATGQLKRLFAKETARLHLLEGDQDVDRNMSV